MNWIKRLCVAALIIYIILSGAMIFKLNTKINNLYDTVMAVDFEEETTETDESVSQMEIIPELGTLNGRWRVTQFGELHESQEVCYIITNNDGLVIIDGGCDFEAPRLRKIIEKYGNKVEAWFLSHPHDDHIGAFMDIYDDLQGIEIEHIYTAQHPSIERMQEIAPWDHFEACERFYNMNVPVEYLHRGDEVEVLNGLKIKVLSAFDETIAALTKDYMNDGALMLKVSGKKNSMLFVTDVGQSLTDFLVNEWGKELRADYVQMGHHGNGGPGKKFYKKVRAKAAYFDATEFIMKNDTKPTTKKNMALMNELGAVIYTYYTTPNQVVLE